MLPDDPPLPTLWPPPKAPLSPQRLAKLANALGVPIPALHPPIQLRLQTDPTLSPPSRSLSLSAPPSPTSRYLLHVIPPVFLPHTTDESRFTPVPSSASGYHTQYRRGILVPVYANFQSQLAAIAKEYALPSAVGMILYLVSSGSSSSDDGQMAEPGPRLSEDVWKHIWTRVVGTEQPSQLYRLGSREDGSPVTHPRPLLSTPIPKPLSSPSTVAPSSSTSSTSDLRLNAASSPITDPDTPNTSSSSVDETATKSNAYILPGLGSPSLIPVLAKVEFDIDRKRAQWYEPWLKSRRLNHAKRAQTADDEQDYSNKPPVALLTGTKGAAVPHINESELDILPNAASCKHSTIPNSSEDPHLDLNEPSSQPNAGGNDEKCHAHARIRRPEDSEKRVATYFEDLDLGIGIEMDFDDRRRSQLLMKAKLDEIERTMMQLSPRALKSISEDDSTLESRSSEKTNYLLPSHTGDMHSTNVRRTDSDVFDLQNPPQAWPAVPYVALKESMNPAQADGPHLTPQLAVNGISTGSPMPFIPARSSSMDVSSETNRRKKQLEEEYSSGLVVEIGGNEAALDTLFPLSPDPFRRYPSSQVPPVPPLTNIGRSGTVNGSAHSSNSGTFSNHFSVESMDEAGSKPNNRATMMSVKNIKKLWRKSDKLSQSHIQLPPAGRPSLSQPPQGELNLPPPVPEIAPSLRISRTPGLVTSGRPSIDQSLTSTNQSSRRPSQPHSPPPFRYPSKSAPPSPTPPQTAPETRKSILKWRSKSRGESISQNIAGAHESRPSVDQSRPSSRASIGRRPSANGLNPGHVLMASADIPPSPPIPEHLLNDTRQMRPLSPVAPPVKQRLMPYDRSSTNIGSERPTRPWVKSPSPDSHGTQPNFDPSQFEIVYPKKLT